MRPFRVDTVSFHSIGKKANDGNRCDDGYFYNRLWYVFTSVKNTPCYSLNHSNFQVLFYLYKRHVLFWRFKNALLLILCRLHRPHRRRLHGRRRLHRRRCRFLLIIIFLILFQNIFFSPFSRICFFLRQFTAFPFGIPFKWEKKKIFFCLFQFLPKIKAKQPFKRRRKRKRRKRETMKKKKKNHVVSSIYSIVGRGCRFDSIWFYQIDSFLSNKCCLLILKAKNVLSECLYSVYVFWLCLNSIVVCLWFD